MSNLQFDYVSIYTSTKRLNECGTKQNLKPMERLSFRMGKEHTRDVVKKLGKFSGSIASQVIEFLNQLFCASLADGQRLEWGRLILQKVSIVRDSQMHPHI
jgi:hypothetical protein